jgi:uncharacterized Zn-finger protein
MAHASKIYEDWLFPVLCNDRAAPEIRVGVREFNCIGAAPPNDHPHVYLAMGDHEVILCTYCSTRFRFDPGLDPLATDPPDCLYWSPVAQTGDRPDTARRQSNQSL